MWRFFGEEGEQLDAAGLEDRLGEMRRRLGEELVAGLRKGGREVLGGVEKVVFFYGNGLSDDCDYCKRAMFLFAVALCLRELVVEIQGQKGAETGTGSTSKTIPIYMPAFDTLRRWNPAEEEFLHKHGVEFVESNAALFLEVDERTVVVSYRNFNPVKQVVADLARPAILICRPVAEDPEQDFSWKEQENDEGETVRVPTVRSRFIEPAAIVVDPDSPRVREMVKGYEAHELPELPGEKVDKEVLSLYMRKAGTSTKAEYYA